MLEEKLPFNSFIGGWYIPEKTCDDLVDYYNENPHLVHQGPVGKPPQVKLDEKESFDINFNTIIDPMAPEKVILDYITQLQKCLELYLKKYKYCNYSEKFNISEQINLQKYPVGGGFKRFHYERMCKASTNRYLVFMTYLNDVKDGGTEFFYQKLKTPAKKGLTLIWPSEWTHTHKGIISKRKEKIIITGWYSFV
tara:strand:+ start:415 stop:999 length:585 start_codon:yes stop_codon:yes gene_type:complete